MPVEIERKFLVRNGSWRPHADRGTHIKQGYIVTEERCAVRIRMKDDGRNILTVKFPQQGIGRYEFEQEIELREAEDLMKLSGEAVVEKRRYEVPQGENVWEIDVFSGANEGLVVAEIELDNENQGFERPEWLGDEVTDDPRYKNALLALHPYRGWE